MKIGIKAVALNRAEGPVAECGPVLFLGGEDCPPDILDSRFFGAAERKGLGSSVAAEVEKQLREWGKTAPADGGYDKVDFEVAWESGERYAGRFDLERGGTAGGETFWQSLRRRVEYAACIWRPEHFKDDMWRHHCEQAEKQGWKAEAEELANAEWDLGGVT